MSATEEVIGQSLWTETSSHFIMRDGVAQPYSGALPVRILKLKKQTMRAANSRNPNLQGYLSLSERESHAALYQLRSHLLH